MKLAVLLRVLCTLGPLLVVDGLKPRGDAQLIGLQSTSRFMAIANKCGVPEVPSIGSTGYTGTSTDACEAKKFVDDGKECKLGAKENFICVSPGTCKGVDMKFSNEKLINGDSAGCMGKHTTKEFKIETIVLKGDKLAGATVVGTYLYEGGASTAFSVSLDTNYFDCQAFGRSTNKLTEGFDSQSKGGVGLAPTLSESLSAQSDFIAEVQYTLGKNYGLQFNGLTIEVTIAATAEATMKGSASFKKLELQVTAGVALTATGDVKMRYFGASAEVKAGAYAEAGILIEFDKDWNFNFDLAGGCLLGTKFKTQLAVGNIAMDAMEGITKAQAGFKTLKDTWDGVNGSPFQSTKGDAEYKAKPV